MPNGYAYFLRSSEDFCQNCGDPLHDHDKEQVPEGNGRYSYDYYCTDGSRYDSPIQENDEGD